MLPYLIAGAAGLVLLGAGATRRKKHHGDPRTAETQRLRIVDSRHAKTQRMARVNPNDFSGRIRTLADHRIAKLLQAMWNLKQRGNASEEVEVVYKDAKKEAERRGYVVTGGAMSKSNPDVLNHIRAGDRITIVTPHGQRRTGRAVMRGPAGWVLNLGGAHGTPGIATNENIVKIVPKNKRNPTLEAVDVTHCKKCGRPEASAMAIAHAEQGEKPSKRLCYASQFGSCLLGRSAYKHNPKRRGKVKRRGKSKRVKVRRKVNGKWKTTTTVTRTVKKVLTNPKKRKYRVFIGNSRHSFYVDVRAASPEAAFAEARRVDSLAALPQNRNNLTIFS